MEWISVEKELPAVGVLVDTLIDNSNLLNIERVRSNFIEEDTYWAYYFCVVTHWKPKVLVEISEKKRNELIEGEFFYKQGASAFHKDLYLNLNPYPLGTVENLDWDNGWLDAKMDSSHSSLLLSGNLLDA